jgi:single-stranded-DNA-specific exonuclease
MAAGLTVRRDQLEAAMARLGDLLARQGAGQGGPRDLAVDGVLMPEALTLDLVSQIEAAGPFGASAPAPRFVLPDQRVLDTRRMGESHLRLTCGSGAARVEVVCFGAFDGPLGPALAAGGAGRFHLAGRIEVNTWGGRQKVQMRLEDAAPA